MIIHFDIVIEECPGTAVAASIDVRVSVGALTYTTRGPSPPRIILL